MKYLKYARNKHSIIKRILALDAKYTSDYLMTWHKQDLLDYYNKLVKAENKKEVTNEKNN